LYTSKLPHLKLIYDEENLPTSTPTIARDEPFAQYKTPVGHSWPNDPYIKGSYHNIAPGQEEVLTALQELDREMVKTLFAPIDGKLFFAGEHASILMDVPGTLEAACESGERTARMIQRLIS
jgi:monoamine oxidase